MQITHTHTQTHAANLVTTGSATVATRTGAPQAALWSGRRGECAIESALSS